MIGASFTACMAALTSFNPLPVFNTSTGSSRLDPAVLHSSNQSGIGGRPGRLGEYAGFAQGSDGSQDLGIADQDIAAAGLGGSAHGAHAIARQVDRDAIRQGFRRDWGDLFCICQEGIGNGG